MGEDETTVYESETRTGRAEVAAFLRQLADGIEQGRVVLGSGDDRLVIEPPAELGLEVEVELEADGDDEVESSIEIEITW